MTLGLNALFAPEHKPCKQVPSICNPILFIWHLDSLLCMLQRINHVNTRSLNLESDTAYMYMTPGLIALYAPESSLLDTANADLFSTRGSPVSLQFCSAVVFTKPHNQRSMQSRFQSHV